MWRYPNRPLPTAQFAATGDASLLSTATNSETWKIDTFKLASSLSHPSPQCLGPSETTLLRMLARSRKSTGTGF